jgi:predicted MFS family arabinose efflux permease
VTGPWRRRDFRLIWGGGLVNDTGDWLLMVALPVYVLTKTGSGTTTALIFIAQLVPTALLGSFAGNLVDRWNLRRVVVVTNLAQAVTLLPLLAVTSHRTWPAFAVAVVQAVLTRFNNPANAALLVRVVPDTELTAANGARALGENVARLVGSPLGGILVAVGGLPLVVVVDGVSFLVVAAATAAVRSDARALPRTASPQATAGTHRALGVLRRTRPLPALFSTLTLSQVAQGMFVVLFLAFVVRRLGGDGSTVGIVRGAQAIGGIAGGALFARSGTRRAPATLIGVGFGGMAVWGFLTWNLPVVTTAIPPYVALMALVGPFAVACSVGVTTAAQRFTPPAYLGLCVGSLEASSAVGQAVGAVGAGVLLDRVPLTALLNAQAAIYVLPAVVGFAFVRPRPSGAVHVDEEALRAHRADAQVEPDDAPAQAFDQRIEGAAAARRAVRPERLVEHMAGHDVADRVEEEADGDGLRLAEHHSARAMGEHTALVEDRDLPVQGG